MLYTLSPIPIYPVSTKPTAKRLHFLPYHTSVTAPFKIAEHFHVGNTELNSQSSSNWPVSSTGLTLLLPIISSLGFQENLISRFSSCLLLSSLSISFPRSFFSLQHFNVGAPQSSVLCHLLSSLLWWCHPLSWLWLASTCPQPWNKHFQPTSLCWTSDWHT